jgi:hypothetical protein
MQRPSRMNRRSLLLALMMAAVSHGCGDDDPLHEAPLARDLEVGAFDGDVAGLWGSGPNDVFLVSRSNDAGTVDRFDGDHWTRMAAKPQWSVSGTSARDVWTAGRDVLHYEGASWQHPIAARAASLPSKVARSGSSATSSR